MRKQRPSARTTRGYTLLYVLFMLPLGMILLLSSTFHVNQAMVEGKRNLHRAQARLLAESALVVYRHTGLQEGLIDGMGEYRLTTVQRQGENKPRLEAAGTIVAPKRKVTSRLMTDASPDDPKARSTIRIISTRYEIEPISPLAQSK